MRSVKRVALASAFAMGLGVVAMPTAGWADTFNLTSCHISTGCPVAGTVFGTVSLTQSGTSVLFDVVLNNGSRFVETGAGGGSFFLFNDSIIGSTITNISVTLNGTTLATPLMSGLTNQSPIHADGTGDFTAAVFCTTASDCNGGSAPNINDLHFTVTGATLAGLETQNALGNFFVADILCGANVTGCAGQTGPVDASTPAVPIPPAAMLFGSALVGLGLLGRRRRKEGLAQA